MGYQQPLPDSSSPCNPISSDRPFLPGRRRRSLSKGRGLFFLVFRLTGSHIYSLSLCTMHA